MAPNSLNISRGFSSVMQTRRLAAWVRSPSSAQLSQISWRRSSKFALGAALVAVGGLTIYQQVGLRASREAVINARVTTIRASMDGIFTTNQIAPGRSLESGGIVGGIEDPAADDARVFQLQQEVHATEREHDTLVQRIVDLRDARNKAEEQAEAYRLGRVRQDELRVEEARASVSAANARESEAFTAERRGSALHARGFMADAAYERVLHAREVTQQDTIAARKRLDALTVELDAARNGTYLGDNYNDVPSSFQRARDLSIRIEETQGQLEQLARKQETLATELAAERTRLLARMRTAVIAPIEGNVWTVHATSGEFVRKGQELFSILDCSTAIVTASVSERDYNELRLGDSARFRVAGSGREYSGTVGKLGLTSTGRSFAIAPEERRHQVAVQLANLQGSATDRCAVGRTGEVVFEGPGHGAIGRFIEGVRRLVGLS